jgi:sugar (pentulose or hexulose) kinase
MKETETASLGAAILAGTGAAVFSDIRSACRQAVKADRVSFPDPERSELYKKVTANYIKLNGLLENYWQC